MKPGTPADQPAPKRRGGQTMAFRKHSAAPRPTPEQLERQNYVLQSAWRHFGEAAPVIAFLNTPNDQLDGQPLHLAVESAEGLMRVEKLLADMTLRT